MQDKNIEASIQKQLNPLEFDLNEERLSLWCCVASEVAYQISNISPKYDPINKELIPHLGYYDYQFYLKTYPLPSSVLDN